MERFDDFGPTMENIYRLDERTSISICEDGIFKEDPRSALKLCASILRNFCLLFGFSSAIDNETISFLS